MEVHKTDSSDDEEMEDAVVNASGSGIGNEAVSSNESVSMEEVRQDWTVTRMNTGGDTSGSDEEPFEMTPIRCEISTLSRDENNV